MTPHPSIGSQGWHSADTNSLHSAQSNRATLSPLSTEDLSYKNATLSFRCKVTQILSVCPKSCCFNLRCNFSSKHKCTNAAITGFLFWPQIQLQQIFVFTSSLLFFNVLQWCVCICACMDASDNSFLSCWHLGLLLHLNQTITCRMRPRVFIHLPSPALHALVGTTH